MRPVLFLILAGDEEECPTGSRCMPVDLCPGAAQPMGPYGRGVGVGHGWVPRRRYPARCASVLPGARVCCWSPYQPRVRRSQPRSQIPSNQANLALFVVGGELALEEEFPYMVAIGYMRGSNSAGGNLVWGCGGSLISDRYVLTAAHCITDAQRFNLRPAALRMGVNNLTQGPQLPTDYSVANITLHPRHRGDLKYFDLALLRTDRPVSFTARQRPVCLEAPDTRIDAQTRLESTGVTA
ncbi:Serine protease snake [Gryllus bimaculatus]|nr:Serine protease snake [Gryllus bimaculatus]